jgi:hypothetical protein
MQNNNLVFWVLLAACLAAGFISGWTIKECVSGNVGFVNKAGGIVRVHDTIKTPVVEYRIIPARDYNVDSLVNAVNQFWKDSLKNLYGKGLFEAKLTKSDKLGKREFTLESRIPVDPFAEITIDEELKLPEVYPQRRFGIYGGVEIRLVNGIAGVLGAKYYILDYKNFSLTGSAEGNYLINKKEWQPVGRIEAEIRF